MMIETKKCINKSLLAGILIGLGVIINTQTQVPIVGPMLFSFGLLVIINMQLNLYTGKIGFIQKFILDIWCPFFAIIIIPSFRIKTSFAMDGAAAHEERHPHRFSIADITIVIICVIVRPFFDFVYTHNPLL